MKKFLVLLVVVAVACMSSMAFAADITTSGSIEMLMRSYSNLDLNDKSALSDNRNYTQERVRLNLDAKAGDSLSGRISMENDWDTWGRFEAPQGNAQLVTANTKTSNGPGINLREAWLAFKVPGAPVGVKAGHMLLQLGNGWFFRDMKYGSDAWVVYTDINALHLGIVNIKVAENDTYKADDTDAYAFVGTYKLSDTASAGVNFTTVNDRSGKFMSKIYGALVASTTPVTDPYFTGAAFNSAQVQNLGLHFAGTVGPAKLAAEFDQQMGKAIDNGGNEHKFKGNQIVLQANMALDPITINATVARGSGATADDGLGDVKEYVALMDADVHYTLIYEYLVKSAAKQSFKTTGTGFANTTAVGLGAGFNVSKNLLVSADAWLLQATQKILNGAGEESNALGMEVDAKINWKMYENLSWNTTVGYFMPGDAYKLSATQDATTATAIHSVLSFKF